MDIESLYARYLACGGVVSTDTRTLKGGEMFFALKGENFDGNEYAMKALDAGAACVVVNEGTEAARAGRDGVVAVPDTLEALQALGRHHRRSVTCDGAPLIVLGLTGTNGKTTTKELISCVLRSHFDNVAATAGNFNNDIGVPLTLLGMWKGTKIAVVEMGANHPDDISRLVSVCEPDLGLITNVGKAHLLGFGSFEGVKKAKGQLYDWIAAHGGEIFLNIDDPNLCEMARNRDGLSILPYGLECDGATVLPSSPSQPFLRMRIGLRVLHTKLVGAYNASNVLAALAVGARFGVPSEKAFAAIEAYTPANQRSQMTKTSRNTLVVDAYNANPSSMAAALDNFATMEAPRKVALLGDMRELGADSLEEHCAIIRKTLGASYRTVFVGSEFARAMEILGLEGVCYPDSAALAGALAAEPLDGCTILIKGSRGIKMETVIPQL